MGKGVYNGSSAQGIMFWLTTDYFVDCDIDEFVQYRVNDEDWWKTTVHYKDYSYELKTRHFNLNVHAKKIVEYLIEQRIEGFKYKVTNNELWKAVSKLNEHVDMLDKMTYYIPEKDLYELNVTVLDQTTTYLYKESTGANPAVQADFLKDFKSKRPELFL